MFLQLELYAVRRADLSEFELDVDHRGYAYFESGETPTDAILLVLTAGQVLMNVAIALIIMRLVTAYYANLSNSENQEGSSVVSIYWANFFLAFLANAVLILGNVVLYLDINIISDISPDALTYRIISDGTTLGLVLLELIVALATPKNDKLYIPFIISQLICCCQCFKCCGNGSGLAFLRKSIHTFAIWVLMIFLQLAAASIIPLIIVCLRDPVPSIAFVTLMASTFFCLIIFIAHLIHISERMKESTTQERFTLILQAFVFLVFFGIVSLVIIIYLSFVRAGTSTGTLGGIFVSLVPSAIISGVAWYTKKNLLNSGSKKLEKPNNSKRVGSFIKKYAGAFHKILQDEYEESPHHENPDIPSSKSDDKVNLDTPEDAKLGADEPDTDTVVLNVQDASPNECQDKTFTEVPQTASAIIEIGQSPQSPGDSGIIVTKPGADVPDADVPETVMLNVQDALPKEPQDMAFTEVVPNGSVATEFEKAPEGSGTVVTNQALTSESVFTTSNMELEIEVVLNSGM